MSAKTSDENPPETASDPDNASPDATHRSEPIEGGRRLGDDPFLADEGLFWWLPRTFSLLVVAVALMLLGAHFFGGDDAGSVDKVSAEPAQKAAVQPTVAPPPVVETVRYQQVPAMEAPLTSAIVLERGRSYNARRRILLQEAEALLRQLPDDNTATPESDRDRRALRDFVQRMDTPAR